MVYTTGCMLIIHRVEDRFIHHREDRKYNHVRWVLPVIYSYNVDSDFLSKCVDLLTKAFEVPVILFKATGTQIFYTFWPSERFPIQTRQ